MADQTLEQKIAAKKAQNEAAEEKKTKKEQPKIIDNIKVYSPYRTYFNGKAVSLSAANATGPFDILAGHKNFLTLLLPGDLIIRTNTEEEKFKIDRGVLHMRDNQVTVFLDI